MNPSDLPWWAWLPAGAFLAYIGLVMFQVSLDKRTRLPGMVLGGLLTISGLISILIGIIRFVKWAWAG